jgi:ADP-heptose:LPS heptosyltransferase
MVRGGQDLSREEVLGILSALGAIRAPHDVGPELARRLLSALADDRYHNDVTRVVCELATDADPLVRRRVQELLFAGLAEPLGDAFDPASVKVHDSLFSLAIDVCRRLPSASRLDARLGRFGVHDRMDLLCRRSGLTPTRPLSHEARHRIRKVFVLSRITLGADVAITSTILQVIQRVFPDADRHFVGPAGVGQLFEGLSGTRIVAHGYERNSLLERLGSWCGVTEVLERETVGLVDAEWLVIDPDSRVTQLCLLPVAPPTVPYVFFESRSYRAEGLETLGGLATHWVKGALGCEDGEVVRPRLELASADIGRSSSIVDALRHTSARFVVAMNLGVGGNPRKRVAGDFELDVVRSLLRDGSAVVLDHGAGEDEARVRAIVAALRNEGRRITEIEGAHFGVEPLPAGCDVVAYRGPVGPFAALIGASDMYVGYDSGFQHIAAAQGIPAVDVFVDPPNPLFARRWRPHSAAAVAVIETTTDEQPDAILTRVADACRRFRAGAP